MVNLLDLVAKIKEKKELANLDDEYVLQYIEKQLTTRIQEKMSSAKNDKQFYKSKEYKELQSSVRKQLRETYGMFQERGREKLLQEYLATKEEVTLKKILHTHQSTQERLPYYKKLYADLFAITGVPQIIFDVGCGLNPLSYPFLGCTPRFVCTDISTADAAFLNKYFTACNIDGNAYAIDALEDEQVAIIAKEKPDIVFMFKLMNTLETIERHSTKKLFAAIAEHTSWIIVSFATVSLGGGKFISPSKFAWFENYLEKNEWTAKAIDLPNEKFYVVKVEK